MERKHGLDEEQKGSEEERTSYEESRKVERNGRRSRGEEVRKGKGKDGGQNKKKAKDSIVVVASLDGR